MLFGWQLAIIYFNRHFDPARQQFFDNAKDSRLFCKAL